MRPKKTRRFTISLSAEEAKILWRFSKYGELAVSGIERENGVAEKIQSVAKYLRHELTQEFDDVNFDDV